MNASMEIPYLPNTIQYASSIQLEIELNPNKVSYIYSPVLSLQYSSISTNPFKYDPVITTVSASQSSSQQTIGNPQVSEEQTVTYTLTVSYFTDLTSFHSTLKGFIIFGIVLVILLSLFRFRNWYKRNSRVVDPRRFMSGSFGPAAVVGGQTNVNTNNGKLLCILTSKSS